jgi:hypothetical protein
MIDWYWIIPSFVVGAYIGYSIAEERLCKTIVWWQERCICEREEKKGRKVTQTFGNS